MKTLRGVLVAIVCLGGVACATTVAPGSTAALAARTSARNTFEVQGSTAGVASALREVGDHESGGPVIIDRGIPTPQPAREPAFATPVPQPPIPGPIRDNNTFARYPKLAQ